MLPLSPQHRGDSAGVSPIPIWKTRRFRLVAYAVALVMVSYGLRRPLFLGNLASVDADRVYRSAQPGRGLEGTIHWHHLRSIVNLRGGSPSDPFYVHETEVARRLGVEFHDLPMSATKRPSRRTLLHLLHLFDTTTYPLLIHCKWGSDRTGLVSALYRMMVVGDPPERAMRQFSLSYGHVPLFGPQHLHEPIDEYAQWLKAKGLTHTPPRFREWVEREYPSDDAPISGVAQADAAR